MVKSGYKKYKLLKTQLNGFKFLGIAGGLRLFGFSCLTGSSAHSCDLLFELKLKPLSSTRF